MTTKIIPEKSNTPIDSSESRQWVKWPALEGLTKAVSKVFQKFIGVSSSGVLALFVVRLVIGSVQVVGAFVGVVRYKQTLRVPLRQMMGGIWFGIIATVMGTIGLFLFQDPAADITTNTFLIAMSIVPGALIDHVFFKDKLTVKQWSGILVFIVAGYFILGFPSLRDIVAFPLWIWLSILLALFSACNEAITRSVKKANVWVHNVWVGLTKIVLSSVVLFAALFFMEFSQIFFHVNQRLVVSSIFVGLIVLAMVSFKVLSYTFGGSIAAKKFVMWSVYLTLTMIAGAIFYGEQVTLGRVLGIVGFFVGYALLDKRIVTEIHAFVRKKFFQS